MHGVDAKIARIFTTYGPRMRLFQGMLIPDFILSAIDGKDLVINGDENLSMSLCYISDMITGLTKLMAADPEVRIINLGDEKIVKLSDVAQMIIQMTNSNSKVTFEAPLVFLTKKGAPDLAYVKDVLGWMPLTRLEDGLEKTIEYVVANKEALLFNNKS